LRTMNRAVEVLATWFYLGHLKPAPGTWGTLGAIPLIMLLKFFGPMGYLAGVFGLATLAIVVAQLYEKTRDGHDHCEIVIDEVAGFAVTMTWLPSTWQAWLIGFALFRILDVIKPPPIRWFDRRVPGGVGVVADDLVAGIVANVILQIMFVQTTWLGYQLPS
jgi:phosphatidylglycerophosphatase A